MTKKQYDLEEILSKNAYKAIVNYATDASNPNYGLDGMALIGRIAFDEKYQDVSINKAIDSFHNLADPTFINLADEWGSTYQADNQMVKNIGAYANEKFNSFSLKGQPSNLSYLPFPLRGNRMSADKNFANHPFPSDWESVKESLEKTLNIKIAEGVSLQDAQNDMFEKLLSPAVRVKGTNSVLLSQNFNDAKLSDAEKFLAVVDVISHENTKKLLSEDKALASAFKNIDAAAARQILYAGQITADMFAALASNLGAENHKQIENALRLELCGTLANMADKSAYSVNIYARVAEKLTQTLLDQLHQTTSNIVLNRANMGIGYVDNLYPNSKDFILEQPNLKAVMFGRTINYAFKFENDKVMFVGNSPAFDLLQPNAKEYAPQPQADVAQSASMEPHFASAPQPVQEDENFWIPEAQPDGSLPSKIDWILEDPEPEIEEELVETQIDEFDALKIKALEDKYDLPLPAASEAVQPAQSKSRSLADLVAQTRVARRDAEMFAKPAPKTTTQTKLFGDDYAPTAAKPLERNPQVETQQTTLAEYNEKTYLDIRPLIENVPVIDRSILHKDMQDFDLSKFPIFDTKPANSQENTTEKTQEELAATTPAQTKPENKKFRIAIMLPKEFEKAIDAQNFKSAREQEFLKCLYKAVKCGDAKVQPRRYAQEALAAGIHVPMSERFVYVATSEEALCRVRKELDVISDKYKKIARKAAEGKYGKTYYNKNLNRTQKTGRQNAAKKLVNASRYKISLPKSFMEAQKANNYATQEVQKMFKVLYRGCQNKEIFVMQDKTTKQKVYYAKSNEVAQKYDMLLNNIYCNDVARLKKQAEKLKFVATFAEYLADENQGVAGAKKLAFVVDHKKYLEEQAQNARLARARERIKAWQQNNAKKKIVAAVATASALKAETQPKPAKISTRKSRTSCSKRKNDDKKVLHVWKDGHFDFV